MCSPNLARYYAAGGADVIPALYPGVGHLIGAAALTAVSNHYDVVHLHTSSAIIAFALAPTPRLSKIAVTFHGGEEEILNRSLHSWGNRFERYCMKRTATRAHEIATVGTDLAEIFSQLLGRMVTVVANGVDAEAVRSMALCGLQRIDSLGEPRKGRISLVFPGRLIARTKGQDIMIRAFHRLLDKGFDAFLSFIGAGEDILMLKRLAASLGIRERIAFLGYLPRDMELAYMARSDIVVAHLIHDEGFSGVTQVPRGVTQVHLESAVLARPLVTADSTDLEAFAGTIFETKSSDPEVVANLLGYLIEHPREAQASARKSAQIAEREFCWDRVVDKYLNIYACSPRGGSARSEHLEFG